MGASETGTRRVPLPRGTLSQGRIVEAAAELIEAEGADALTMRRLAAALGCEPMSLYKHVAHKDELIDLVIDRVVGDIRPPAPEADWRHRLRDLAAELRRVAVEHPRVFPLLALRLPASPAALAPVEATLAALTDAGLDDDAAVSAFWAVVAYATGALLAETAAATGVEQAFPFGMRELDPVAAPHVSRLAGRLAASDWRAEYERGFELLLASIGARAAESRRVSRSRAGRR